jgi:23S rRNA pseudouridine955/2504/2580 synthase/23S rRNA pseudouridine1911/1915/1917 synthase
LTIKNYSIIFEDESFLAVDKQAGLLSIPDRAQSEKSLKDMLLDKYRTIFTVHRLDKDTSGLMLFAKNEATHKYLSGLFEERKIQKYYLGIVLGAPTENTGMIDAPISEHHSLKGTMTVHRNGRPSQTGYEVLERYDRYSLVAFQLHTGRTHQIRVHCKHWGYPLACDSIYGDGKPIFLSQIKKKFKLSQSELEEKPMLGRLALHSYRLNFADQNGRRFELETAIPKEFRAIFNQIKKNMHIDYKK